MFIFVSVLYNDKDFKEFLANNHEQCIVSVACSLYKSSLCNLWYICIFILINKVLDTTQFAIYSDIFFFKFGALKRSFGNMLMFILIAK